jgi:hypothetical protein
MAHCNGNTSAVARIAPLVCLMAAICVIPGFVRPGNAMSFNISYDSSTSSAPAAFFTAFSDAIRFYQSEYTDPITINIHVGWGEINGASLAPGDLGQSLTNQQGFYSYSQMNTALTNDATAASDSAAIVNLPAIDPYGGTKFVMSNAEAKALGLLAGNASGIDGYVGFFTAATYTFDPNNRTVAGAYDFIGLAEHEISEVMGRYGLGQNGASSGRYSPIDLFRFTSAGVLDLTPENGDYFSIDNGNTAINTYNGTGGGDLSDWAGNTLDSYNESLTLGKELDVTPGDVALMDVIGYDLVPEPATWKLFCVAFAVWLAAWPVGRIRRRRRS